MDIMIRKSGIICLTGTLDCSADRLKRKYILMVVGEWWVVRGEWWVSGRVYAPPWAAPPG